MMRLPIPSVILLALTLTLSGSLKAEDADTAPIPEIASLQQGLESKLADVREPLTALQQQLLDQFSKLETEAQKAGELGVILEIRTQRELLEGKDPDNPKPVTSAKLQRLLDIYEQQKASAEARVNPKVDGVYDLYLEHLQEKIAETTKSGNLDLALKFKEELERVRSSRSATELANVFEPKDNEQIAWELEKRGNIRIVKDCQVDETEKGFQLTSNTIGSHFLTDRSFSTPFRLAARVGTNSTNIRFYTEKGSLAIFNWEVQKAELRLSDPNTGKATQGFPGVGYVPENQLHDIEIEITETVCIISVNGMERARRDGNFSRLRTQLGIGPSHGSVVTVETMRVMEAK